MDKKEIVRRLSKKYSSLRKDLVEVIVNTHFREIAKNLKDSNRIEIRNFGVFKTKNLGERQIYNPNSKALEKVVSKKIPAFKCSKTLHEIQS